MTALSNWTTHAFRKTRKGLLVLAVLAICSTAAYANGGSKGGGGGGGVPELDPRSMAAAFTLLSGGVMMLADRNRAR